MANTSPVPTLASLLSSLRNVSSGNPTIGSHVDAGVLQQILQQQQGGMNTPSNMLESIAAKRAAEQQIMERMQGIASQPRDFDFTSQPAMSSGAPRDYDGGETTLDQLLNAIKGQESGGDYGAVNPNDPSGAYGAYQILSRNFAGPGGWDQEALGHDVSLDEFRGNPELQDQIARFKLGKYLEQYGVGGAARAWNGGPGRVSNPNENVLNYENAIFDRLRGNSSNYGGNRRGQSANGTGVAELAPFKGVSIPGGIAPPLNNPAPIMAPVVKKKPRPLPAIRPEWLD